MSYKTIFNSQSDWAENWKNSHYNKWKYSHYKQATKKANPNAYHWNKDIVELFRKLAENKTKQEIIKMLIGYTYTKIPTNFMPYKRRRHQKIGKPIGKCYVCKNNQAACYHHIILLKNGGFADRMNTIAICNDCHSLIHIWLKKAYTMQAVSPSLNLQGLNRSSSICAVNPGEIGDN